VAMEQVVMHEDATRQLRALNARFIRNLVTNDVKSHAAITHEKFVCLTSKGAREARQAYLARWATGFDPEVIVYWDYRDEHISLFDTVALVRATNKHTMRENGREVTGMTTYCDTYIHENGAWKCIQAQLTSVSPEHYPGDETIVRKYIKGELQAD
jgi:ketosteroid isomerase-like protein